MTRILVVDDNPTIQRMLMYVVEAQGYQAVRAGDGMEALVQLKQKPFDLVIADIKMPRMDGLSLLAEIRDTPALASLPVLLLTARLDAYDEEVALKDQRTTFMTKPLASGQLAAVVAQMLSPVEADRES